MEIKTTSKWRFPLGTFKIMAITFENHVFNIILYYIFLFHVNPTHTRTSRNRHALVSACQKYCKKSMSTSSKFINLAERILKKQKVSNYSCNWWMWVPCSAQQAQRLDSQILRHSYILFGRGLEHPDHQEALKTRRGPKSMHRASLRSRFQMWSCSATPWFAGISTKPCSFWARIGAPGPPRCPWKTVRTIITAPRESKNPISNESIGWPRSLANQCLWGRHRLWMLERVAPS